LAGTRTPAPGSWTPSPLRRPEWAESKGATTGARRSAAARGTCWWILKGWCSEPRYTAPRSTTRMASSCWLLESARIELSRLKHLLWVEAGYRGRGRRRWAEETLGLSVEVVRKPPKPPVPEKVVAKVWAEEWAKEEGKEVDWQRLMPPRGFRVLPRRWVVERTFAWISHNRRMAKDYERLCATGESFVYAAMTRLMVRRLARA
jgi:transposase